ncbi:MAG: M1 family aminopeptidase [Burkholderiales bacterium]|nr:M1 family aminopeptidase [Burkholderiales bacterium]
MRHSLISVAILGLFALPAVPTMATPASAKAKQITTQLPRTVKPRHYDVSLVPNAAASSFAGQVRITLDVLTASASITLNATDLAFSSAQLVASNGKALPAKIKVNAAEQTATFTFSQPIAKGSYRLALDYTGVIGTQANGLFSLDYDTPTGKKRALYSQFENSDARRMIPSWDEPQYKATFALDVVAPDTEMAVSNMPIASKTAMPDGRSLIKFGVSPKMSTYLLFFGMGDFERATATVDGTELGIITRRGVLPQAESALEASKVLLREYNDYFGVKYPLPKLDNIAAPGRNQVFGAMENWGAIFSFEAAMLLDPTISTQSNKEAIFSIAAHEMAHQWFGDLVTMQWWDDLWLNEGFAEWMESRTTARLHPEWNTSLNAVGARNQAMNLDSLRTTHPVVQHVATVEQANQAFDEITYQKGEAVIRMLENYVGEKAWRDGVRAYMKQHAYGNTKTDDFWHQIEKTAGKPVTAIAHDFTKQAGIPMIRVEDVTCAAGKTSVTLTQTEFSRDQPNKKPLSWRVPVTAQLVGSDQVVRTLVRGGKGKLSLTGCGAVLVNAGQTGYYRTLYAPETFAPLAEKFAVLSPIDQLGVLSDSWALGLTDLQPLSNLLDLAQATSDSADPQIWQQIAGDFSTLYRHYEADPKRQQLFAQFALKRLAPIMAKTGWDARDAESSSIINLRETLILTMSYLDDSATIAEARRRFEAQASDAKAVPAALRKTILSIVAYHADQATWDKLHTDAQAEKSPMIKDMMYGLLSSSKDKELAQRAMEIAMTDEPGATISAGMLAGVAGKHPDMAFDFAISKYADNHVAPDARRNVDIAIASIQLRIKLRAERLPAIDAWLLQHQKIASLAALSQSTLP